MKICVLGHKGLLGNAVHRYFSADKNYEVVTTGLRWPDRKFLDFIRESNFEWIINCAAKIPQAKPSDKDMVSINLGLPVFLSAQNAMVLYPSTNLLNADSIYSLSKASAEEILQQFDNTYIIRCSIIGIETGENARSLLSWFLAQKDGPLKGYINHSWNGISSLAWANLAFEITQSKFKDRLIIPYSNTLTKYELLLLFKEVFKKEIEINPVSADTLIPADPAGNYFVGELSSQVSELKIFYDL